MRKSFRIKLVTIFLIEVVLCMVTITIASRFMIKPLFIYNSKANMENYSESIETTFDNNPTGLSEVLHSINISHSINAMVVDVDKNMVYSSSGIQLLSEEKEYKNYIRWIDKYKSQENEKGETYFKEMYLQEIENKLNNLIQPTTPTKPTTVEKRKELNVNAY